MTNDKPASDGGADDAARALARVEEAIEANKNFSASVSRMAADVMDGLRAPVKGRQRGEKIAKQSVADAGEFVAPLHPTVEEQFDRDASLMQALHDPENQPSQYGTVPMSYLDNQKPNLLRRAWNRVKRVFRYRSAETGLFVSKQHAEANPDTTVRERAD